MEVNSIHIFALTQQQDATIDKQSLIIGIKRLDFNEPTQTKIIFNNQYVMSTDIENIKKRIKAFVKERDWEQFHNAKDLALALSIEVAELNECFLWKSHDEANVDKIKEELADILIYAILFADKYGFDIPKIINEKVEKNAAKYPIDKAKGNAKKYTDL